MIITLSWLKNHLNTQVSLNKIIEGLTNIGLEVENVKENQNNLNDFKIKSLKKQNNE